LPLERGGNVPVRIGGHSKIHSVDYREITPGYFAAIGVSLLRGRTFAESDSPEAPKVAIINEAFARRWFTSRDPVGGQVVFLGIGPGSGGEAVQIAGVVGDVRSSLNEPAPPTVFIPIAQASYSTDQLFQGWFPTSILVRTTVKPLSLSRAVTEAVRNTDPSIPVGQVRSMEEVLSTSLAFQRFLATLMSLFAGLALLLAAVGIYGVISYSVSQRTHEIGIRMALGAQRRDVLLMVIRQGLTIALVGVGAGLIAALALTRLMVSMLYGVKPSDPATFVAVSFVLAGVALLATYIPARRATNVDPMVALRYE
jgi:putative ABC transport system permease protein